MKKLLIAVLSVTLSSIAHAGTPTTKSLSAPVDATPAKEGDNAEELAKIAQNPVGNLISLPLQWNMGFGAGPTKTYQSTLNIQLQRRHPAIRRRLVDPPPMPAPFPEMILSHPARERDSGW